VTLLQQIRKLMRRLTPEEVAASELADAELSRLEAHSAVEYATSVVNYQNARIKRLRKFLVDAEYEDTQW